LIAFVAPGSLRQLTGGYIYDKHIVDGLRRLGHRVLVKKVSERFPNPSKGDLAAAARVLASIPRGTVVVVDGLAAGAMPRQIENEAERLRFVALVHHPLAHETGVSRADAVRLWAHETWTLQHVRHVVVTSPRTSKLLMSEYGVKPAQLSCIEPGTEEWPAARGPRRNALLCVATLTPRKGHVTLIRALARIAHLDWHLTCLGSLERDKATVKRVRHEIRKARLDRRVTLAGETGSREQLKRHYRRADLFVLPTEYEGYGMAVAEAIAGGVPVVSTPTGAIPQLVGRDAGLLVPRGDVNALARVLARVLSDRTLFDRLRAGALKRRRELPRWEHAVRQFAKVLRKVETT
jgi:glycosyltransferase involved in cell wall biosynthesis